MVRISSFIVIFIFSSIFFPFQNNAFKSQVLEKFYDSTRNGYDVIMKKQPLKVISTLFLEKGNRNLMNKVTVDVFMKDLIKTIKLILKAVNFNAYKLRFLSLNFLVVIGAMIKEVYNFGFKDDKLLKKLNKNSSEEMKHFKSSQTDFDKEMLVSRILETFYKQKRSIWIKILHPNLAKELLDEIEKIKFKEESVCISYLYCKCIPYIVKMQSLLRKFKNKYNVASLQKMHNATEHREKLYFYEFLPNSTEFQEQNVYCAKKFKEKCVTNL